jgi:hypothetical protein
MVSDAPVSMVRLLQYAVLILLIIGKLEIPQTELEAGIIIFGGEETKGAEAGIEKEVPLYDSQFPAVFQSLLAEPLHTQSPLFTALTVVGLLTVTELTELLVPLQLGALAITVKLVFENKFEVV